MERVTVIYWVKQAGQRLPDPYDPQRLSEHNGEQIVSKTYITQEGENT